VGQAQRPQGIAACAPWGPEGGHTYSGVQLTAGRFLGHNVPEDYLGSLVYCPVSLPSGLAF
jgi:hypothetical protein